MITVADTAFSIAAVRAEEGDRPEPDRLFVDPYAHHFAAAGAHAAEATQRFLDLPGFHESVRLRTRYIDDGVRDGINCGLKQCVILGAGFDMRGLRLPEVEKNSVAVFEVDTPQQMARKQAVLKDAGVIVPKTNVYVPHDFDQPDFEQRLTATLQSHGFRVGVGALFVWEGVIGYIDAETIDRSLRFMATLGGSGSRLLLTYGYGSFDPEGAHKRVCRSGFTSFEGFAIDDVWRRYLPGEPHPAAWTSSVGTASVSTV